MRLASRMSSVLAATALVGTSLTIAGPAFAADVPESDTEGVISEQVDESTGEEALPGDGLGEEAAPADEAEQPAAPEDQQSEESVAEPQDVAPLLLDNPRISAVRAMDDGQTVTTEGWVTAAYRSGGLNGFTIQSAGTGGACDLTGQSDAIFVYTNHSDNIAPTPEIGQYVTVTGKLTTYSGMRQIDISPAKTAKERYTVVEDTSGLKEATPISCAWPATDAERTAIQSMLYLPTSEAGFAVTNNYDANTFGSLTISTVGEPLWQPSDVTSDQAQRDQIAASNKANSFVLDDGATTRFAGGSATNNKLVPPYVSATGEFAVGAEITFDDPVVVEYRNNKWTLNPTSPITTTATEVTGKLPVTGTWQAPSAPGALGGDLVVGGFNLENYFPTNLGANWSAAFPEAGCTSYNDNQGNPVAVNRCSDVTKNGVTVSNPRGAWTQQMLDYQTDTLVTAINELDAAALGVMELENSYKLSFGDASKAGDSAKYLVDALNKAAGSDKWDFVEPVPANQEPIAQQDVMYPGIIYQPAKVTAVEGGQLTLNDQSAEGQAFGNARAPFGQLFVPTGGGEPFFLVANHFKSKSGSGDGDNADVGEGGWNGDRTRQAQELADWVNGDAKAELKEATGYEVDSSVLVGDFNSYTFEKPMLALYEAGFSNVNIVGGEPENASYNYSGLNGSLDHVIVSNGAKDRITGHAIWNVNATQQIGLHYSRFDYTGGEFVQKALGTPLRGSDHDPAVVGMAAGKYAEPNLELTLLNINDFHGRIDGVLNGDATGISPGSYDKDGKWVPGSTTMNFAYTVDSLRNAAPWDNSLFLSAGDNVGASLFASALAKDQATIDLLNTLGLGATAAGNHEFDAGWADLRDRLQEEFDGPILAANVYKEGTTTPVLPEYAMLSAAGLKVAVIGAVTQDTPTLVNPANVAGLTFGDPVEAVNRVVGQLKALPEADQPDIIVAEYHEGAAAVSAATTLEEKLAEGGIFARIVNETDPAVNVIFNGHTHQEYTWNGPVPGAEGQTRPIVSTGNYGENVGKVVLSVGKDSHKIEDYSMELVNVAAFTKGKTVDEMVGDNPVLNEAYGIVLEALQNAKIEGDVPVAKMTQTISRDYTKGTYVDGKWQMENSANNRDNESPMGTLVGNMLRDGTMSTLPEAPDFGVTNPGGLRTDFTMTDANQGIITVAGARAVLPFNNELSVAKMTGAQIVKMLEEQWQRDATGAIPSRSYLQLGLSDNVSYTYHEIDDPKIAGAKLGVIDSVTIDGKALDMDKVYNVGTFEFLAAGGDNFWAFQGAEVIDTGLMDWESWLDYLRGASGMKTNEAGETTFATPIAPDFTRRGVMVEGMPADGLVPGQEVTLTFRDMNVHAVGAPANTELTVSLAGEELGSFPIEKEQGEDGNWTDWATVTFTVPAGFDGEGDLVATAAPTGTEVVVPARLGDNPPPTEPNVRRLAGANRYETNLAVNDAVDLQKGGIVIVATGADYADALSAAPAAAVNDGALFLTTRNGVTAKTLAEIKALEPSRVYVVGGTGAVSTQVVQQLRDATGVFPVRVSGANRYETSAKVFQTFFGLQGADTVFVATGLDFPDAISASAAAGALDAPVLLVNGAKGSNLLPESVQLMNRLGTETIAIAGGAGAVNTTIEKNLAKAFSNVERLGGADRYATNLAINDYVSANAGDTALTGVWVATGTDFPDALSAAPAAGKLSERLVLSNGKCIPKPVVSEWIMGAGSQVEMTTLVGGTGVLPEALMKLPECK